jgi:hypothetical protein
MSDSPPLLAPVVVSMGMFACSWAAVVLCCNACLPIWQTKYLFILPHACYMPDRLCGLVVRVSGYRSRVPGFDSRRFQIFWEAAGLERGPLSRARATEKLFERKNSGSVYKTEVNDRGNLLRWPRDTLYPQKLALTSPTSGGRSVSIVRSRTKAMDFFFRFMLYAELS